MAEAQKPVVIGIVPARGGSKRLPKKNILPLAGKPLVCWAIEAALGASCINTLVVSSDDTRILQIASEYPQIIALRRPPEISQDQSLAISYVKHSLGSVEPQSECYYQVVVIIQPTSPLTTGKDVDATVELLIESKADSAVSVVELQHDIHPYKLKILKGNRLLPFFQEERGRMAAHQIPTIHIRNGAVYASTRSTIDSGRIIGDDCRGHVMPRSRSIDINDETDFKFAEFLIAQNRS